ncbi:MAG: 50S ribosomal protein L21 [bacterium]|nr:50S ribosomal protein L21 [bacterium]
MIAVIKTGGKQYIVKEGDTLEIEKIEGGINDEVSFEEVLLQADEEGNSVVVGTPFIVGAKVVAKVLEQGRGKKITIIKYKPKVRYRRKRGHHQFYTKVQITKI